MHVLVDQVTNLVDTPQVVTAAVIAAMFTTVRFARKMRPDVIRAAAVQEARKAVTDEVIDALNAHTEHEMAELKAIREVMDRTAGEMMRRVVSTETAVEALSHRFDGHERALGNIEGQLKILRGEI